MKATVHVTRRSDIADPQGAAVLRGLRDLGFSEVASVRIDKVITLVVETADADRATADIESMCEQLLANPVMEDYEIRLLGEDGNGA
ncbi:MAG: phosphoribosylformylglycinamidine synthase subunit PurS [Acidimicrobiia bacterium]|nr:phosphoribosylformylglycinamidine synthase subunit PurS [Acidimicrobiia bacterium]